MTASSGPGAGQARAAAWVLLGSFLAAFAGGCVKKPIVRLKGIQIDRLGLTGVNLLLDFDVTNPNWFMVRLYEFEYDMTVEGRRLAGGEMPKPISSISADQTKRYSIPVGLTYESLRPIITRRAGQALQYELTTRTTFNVFGMPVPIRRKRTGKMPPIRAPGVRLKALRMRTEPPKAIEVVFDVHNPNSFSLLLNQVSGGVFAGEQEVLTVYRSETTEFHGGGTTELVVPVRLGVAAMMRALATAGVSGSKLKFKGKFDLDAPKPLKSIFMDEESSP